MKNGAEIVNEFITINEIEYIFGNPGTTEATFMDVVANNKNCEYILSLHESSATGIAAGYALKSGKPAILNIHTYPGLANSLANMYNAYTSGIPLFVIAGQQNRNHLIHSPVLSGNLVELAKTATKTQYEVGRVSDLHIALQKGFLEATESKMPTFLSIPMDIYTDECDEAYFKKTKFLNQTHVQDLSEIINLIQTSQKEEIAFIADFEVGQSEMAKNYLATLSEAIGAHVYSAPFSVHSSANLNSKNYKGILPVISSDINSLLSHYKTVFILGEKITTFFFQEKLSVPSHLTLIQMSNGHHPFRFDYPFDFIIRGEIEQNLKSLLTHLSIVPITTFETLPEEIETSLLADIISHIPRDAAIVTEGSSNDARVQKIATALKFNETYFSPRGGGLGWAMPLSVGLSLASKKHAFCFVGDGGSIFSIQTIWTAARYSIPVVFICFVNNEYKILKDLWKKQIPSSGPEYVALDLKHPELSLHDICSGFGAKVAEATAENYEEVINSALNYKGPTFITVKNA